MGRINSQARLWLAEILYGLITGNYDRVAEIHFEAQYVPAHHDVAEVATALRAVGEPIRGLPVKDISTGRMLDGLFSITRESTCVARRGMYGSARKRAPAPGTPRPLDMNLDRFLGVCRQLNGTIKQGWGVLVEDPNLVDYGARDRLAGRIQERRGLSKEQSERQLQEFMNRHRRWWDPSQQ